MLGGIGMWELALIGGLAMLIFGPSQLPKLGRSIGQTLKEFRQVGKELAGAKDEVEADLREVDRNLRT